MSMKLKIMMSAALTGMTVAVVAQTRMPATNSVSKAEQETPEERAKRVAEYRERKYGGYVMRETAKGKSIYVVNSMSKDTESLAKSSLDNLKKILHVPIKFISGGAVDSKTATSAMKGFEDAGAAVFIVSGEPGLPGVTYAPDERWAIVNAAAMAGDSVRLGKEIGRAFAYVCGCGGATTIGINIPVDQVSDLDKIKVIGVQADVAMKMGGYLKSIGVTPLQVSTYRRACEQGWAPPPANEHQKAIWDEVHTLPTNPLPLTKPTK